MLRLLLGTSVLLASTVSALAGFDRWTTSVEKDPFSGGERVTVDMSTSIRSGIIIFCDTAENGVAVRAIPGFTFDDSLVGVSPKMEFAVDGERITGGTGQAGAVGDNLATAEVRLMRAAALQLVEAFAAAKNQIAVKDGISDRPYLLSVRGSTKAGVALQDCMSKQK